MSIGVTLAGADVVVNQELTKAKVEGVMMEVARMGQRVDHLGQQLDRMGQWVDRMEEKFEQMEKKMDEKFDIMEYKMDKLLIQQSVPNSWP